MTSHSFRINISDDEKRTAEEITYHYNVEKELADKLRNARKDERQSLYISLYDELYRRVPNHPQLTRKADEHQQRQVVGRQIQFLKKFLTADATFMEIGAGDCSLSCEVCQQVKKVYAIDVSKAITQNSEFPPNFNLVISDGCSIPVPEESVTVAYSNQLMEHLHPDDAKEQLGNVYKALAPGGVYVCVTPSRFNGPHDISKYFDKTATGFHLKEYTVTEMVGLLSECGFSKVQMFMGVRNHFVSFPIFPIQLIERLLDNIHDELARWMASVIPLRILLGVSVVGTK